MQIHRLKRFAVAARKTLPDEPSARNLFMEFARQRFENTPQRSDALERLAERLTRPDDWQKVETLGWLWQFFTAAEKTPRRQGTSDRSAATVSTQLFTPQWIVDFLIGQTLEPTLRQAAMPEEIQTIRFLDPCCGTGHFLLAAYDRFERAYRKVGVAPKKIPNLILSNNLWGLDIDPQAAASARTILALRAQSPDGPTPNIAAPIPLSAIVRQTLPTALREKMERSEIVGSLLRFSSDERLRFGAPEFRDAAAERFLTESYDCVVTNPPYLGRKGMSPILKEYVRREGYAGTGNLDTLFIEQAIRLVRPSGYVGIVATQSWLFLPTFEAFRRNLLTQTTLEKLAHFGVGAFPQISGEVVATAAFTLLCQPPPIAHRPIFYRLTDGGESVKASALAEEKNALTRWRQADFLDFPKASLVYWSDAATRRLLTAGETLGSAFDPRQGMATGNNERFLRRWFEVDFSRIRRDGQSDGSSNDRLRTWVPYAKGGGSRRWYGGIVDVIDWRDNGAPLYAARPKAVIRNPDCFFREALSWSLVSTGRLNVRYRPAGAIFDVGGSSLFARTDGPKNLSPHDFLTLALGYLNSKAAAILMAMLNPTVNYQVGDLTRLAFPARQIVEQKDRILPTVRRLVAMAKEDFDDEEISPDFRRPLLLAEENRRENLEQTWKAFQTNREHFLAQFQRLEEKNDRLFLSLLRLDRKRAPKIGRDNERPASAESLFRRQTARDFLSFFIGVLFGRYAPGDGGQKTLSAAIKKVRADGFLLLASKNAPNTVRAALEDFLTQLFGKPPLEANLEFLADSLVPDRKSSARQTLEEYFRTDFWTDHWRRFLNCPIYWRFAGHGAELWISYHRINAAAKKKILAASLKTSEAAALIERLKKIPDSIWEIHRDAGVTKNLALFASFIDAADRE